MIPAWNNSAVIPPIRPGVDGHSPDRSPYISTLVQIVDRFAFTPERVTILKGLLEYRRALRECGIVSGFQWLDGSFMEHKEILWGVPPNDVDVVTFFHLPEGESQQALLSRCSDLFDTDLTKKTFHVDAYPFLLGNPTSPPDVRLISYWHSMWSHRRNGIWKGFIQVDIGPEEDEIALANLNQIQHETAEK